ncbi:MAG: hypothetical protein QG670_2803 [Thermoproteota archaeon]|nr:hypothetical protein [Thermoproteota archaeon]
MAKVKFGIQISARYYDVKDWSELKATALYCEKLGYDSVWFGDHLTTGGSRLECWTVLSALSLITSAVGLGTMVLCNNWRNPSLLAKMAATLDVISDGRLELGIGAGWNETEHETYGYPFPSPRARVERLKEGVEIIKKMWTEDRPSYKGKHYWIREAICDPKPVQKPYPPIMIGGGGEQLTLRVVASCADRWNFGGDIEQYKHKWEILENYCKKVGRDPKEIEKTCFTSMDVQRDIEASLQVMRDVYNRDYDGRPVKQSALFEEWFEKFKTRAVVGTPEECLKRIRELTDAGITYFIFRSARQTPNLKKMRESLQIFAEDVKSQIN